MTSPHSGNTTLLLCICLLTACSVRNTYGQEFKRFDDIRAEGAAYNIFARQGEATVQVLVLGTVPAPGVYEIGADIELDQLLALTGGTTLAATTTTETTITIRLFRRNTDGRELVYEAPLERMLTETELYPPLQDGDVLTVETFTVERTRFTWQDGLTVLTSLATITLLFDRFLQ